MSEPTLVINEVHEQIAHSECASLSPNLDDLEVPDWLTESFIQDILQKQHKDASIEINSMNVQECGGKGENYTSDMFRVGVNFRSKDVSLQFDSIVEVKFLFSN